MIRILKTICKISALLCGLETAYAQLTIEEFKKEACKNMLNASRPVTTMDYEVVRLEPIQLIPPYGPGKIPEYFDYFAREHYRVNWAGGLDAPISEKMVISAREKTLGFGVEQGHATLIRAKETGRVMLVHRSESLSESDVAEINKLLPGPKQAIVISGGKSREHSSTARLLEAQGLGVRSFGLDTGTVHWDIIYDYDTDTIQYVDKKRSVLVTISGFKK